MPPPGGIPVGEGETVGVERRADEVGGACGVVTTLYPIGDGGLYEK